MNKKDEPAIRGSMLKSLFMETQNQAIDPVKILENDVTDLFWYDMTVIPQNKGLVNISIRGEVTTGKSSVGCKILSVIVSNLIKMGKIEVENNTILQDYLFKHIKSDQTEYMRFTLEKEEDTCVLIDEFSSMGETGLNATTEMALYEENSNLFAQRYVHKISCSPSIINDKNANIILDVIGKDTEKKITRVAVSYRDIISRQQKTLGKADIYLGDILDSDFYRRYRVKKFKRLDLLDTHGIRNIKELEFSLLTLETYYELEEIAKVKELKNELILSIIDSVKRKHKMHYSIPTLTFLIMQVKSMLELRTAITKYEDMLTVSKNVNKKELIIKAIKTFKEILAKRITEETRKCEVLEEYSKIE